VTAHLGFQSGDRVETVNEGNVVSLAEGLDGARQVEKLAGPGPDTWRVWPSALAEPCLPGPSGPRASSWHRGISRTTRSSSA
jgi:hypothetical protein